MARGKGKAAGFQHGPTALLLLGGSAQRHDIVQPLHLADAFLDARLRTKGAGRPAISAASFGT
jgi:hypothetical protein